MPITSVIDLVEEVLRLQVLTGPQKTELQSELAPRLVEPRTLAGEMIKRGWLTPYQVNHIIPGRSSELVLGPYVLMERIGEGGMGQVFKALHTVLRRIDAVKVMRTSGHRPGDSLPRFFLEAIAGGKVDHKNLVAVRTADRAGDCVYLAMEYIDGADLGRLVQGSPNGLPILQVCDYIRQTAIGLQHAHEKGLVHRDVKPSNLMVTREGVVKVLDLGLARVQESDQLNARLTRPDAVMGTPDYMSPEQINSSSSVDARSDVYSLGCTFYHLLTGQPPYAGGTMMDKLRRHCDHEPLPMRKQRPDIPEELEAVVRRMMVRAPAQRYQTAGEVVRALGPFCELPAAVALVEPLPVSIPFVDPLPPSQANVPTSQHADTLQSVDPVPVAIPVSATAAEAPAQRKPGMRISRRMQLAIGGGVAGLLLIVLLVKLLTGGKKTDDRGSGNTDKPAPPKPTLVVDPNGELKTLHDAISKAEPGTRIHIKPGVYREQLVIFKPNLELVGDGPVADIVLEGRTSECLVAMGDNLIVKGLTIRGRTGPINNHFAVQVTKGHLFLDACAISSNSMLCVCIQGDSGLRATLKNCKIDGELRGGVLVRGQAEALLENCELRSKNEPGLKLQDEAIVVCRGGVIRDSEKGGVVVSGSARLTLEKVEVTNTDKGGVVVLKKGKAVLKECVIHDNRSVGVLIEENNGSLLEDCDIHGNAKAGVQISNGSQPTLRKCKFHDGPVGLLCEKSGAGFIEECTFTGHRVHEVLILEGGNPTLKKCPIVSGLGAGVSSRENGLGVLHDCEIAGHKEACVKISKGAKLTLIGCTVKEGKDNGINIWDKGEGTLERCKIFGNVQHGVSIGTNGKVTVRGGEITKNGFTGMGFQDQAEGDVEGCDLRGNADGAFAIGPMTRVKKSNNKE